ncbi:hypothetical protein ACHAWT_000288 [Skeletonema menzelii]
MTAASLFGCRLLFFLVIFLTAATSPSSSWLITAPPINYYSNINSRPSVHSSSWLSSGSSLLVSSKLQSSTNGSVDSAANSKTFGGGELRIGKRVGSGTYGTVHIAHLLNNNNNNNNNDDIDSDKRYIAKRAWTLSELELNVPMAVMQLDSANDNQRTGVVCATGLVVEQGNKDDAVDSDDDDDNYNDSSRKDELKERAERCRYYWNVERHIVQKLESSIEGGRDSNNRHVTPQFKGVYQSAEVDDNDDGGEQGEIVPGYGKIGKLDGTDDDNNSNEGIGGFFFMFDDGDNKEGLRHEWMVFEYIPSPSCGDESSPALTLLDAMEMDQQNGEKHHLEGIAAAMNLPSDKFGDTLDAVFVSILEDLKVIHASNVVHRDIKPGNLLCDGNNNRLLLIDFGSAADLDPSSPPSPKQQNNVIGNIFTNAAAGLQQQRQQQQRVGFDDGIAPISPIYSAPETFVKLDENPLAFDVFSAALITCQLFFNLLDERTDRGFTQQLQEANYDLDTWLENSLRTESRPLGFDDALEYLGECRGLWALMKQMLQPDPLNRISSAMALESLNEILALRSGEIDWSDETIAFVAREESYFESVIGHGAKRKRCSSEGCANGAVLMCQSKRFSAFAKIRIFSVFVRGWNASGQADKLGMFEVGDRLRGVGELPFSNAGLEAALDLIQRQPRSGGTLKLHFDRLPKLKEQLSIDQNNVVGQSCKKVVSQGTWKSKGRRGNQEDSFVLHEIRNDARGDVLLAGVFDGHAGTAASESVSNVLPSLFGKELLSSNGLREALEKSWRTTCDLYRNGCDENGECVVDYDPVEGIVLAETGSANPVVAGTTATIAAISMNPNGTNELSILNCGDSKTMLVGEPIGDGSVVAFQTRDHSPDDAIEIERLSRGKELGLDYSIPEDSMYGSYLRVGDFQYALARGLEGTYVTSKGIVSDPDVANINLTTALAGRRYNSLVLACDGLLEVMSSEEIGREVVLMRKAGYKADEVAKNLCGQALKKGSYDNISVIVLHLGDA